MARAVVRGRRAKRQRIIPLLGVDEKAIAKGHQYFTVVNDLERGTVEYVAEDRKQESLAGFYRPLSAEQLAGIEAVAMDMWDPFIAATKAHVPDAVSKIVFDRYHVMTHMLKAVDAVRKAEHRALRAAGDPSLTGSKYLWLYSTENFPEEHTEWFELLAEPALEDRPRMGAGGKPARSVALSAAGLGGAALEALVLLGYAFAAGPGDPGGADLATAPAERADLLRASHHQCGQRRTELEDPDDKKNACGFRNRDHFKVAIYFHCGGLDLYPTPLEVGLDLHGFHRQ